MASKKFDNLDLSLVLVAYLKTIKNPLTILVIIFQIYEGNPFSAGGKYGEIKDKQFLKEIKLDYLED